jgi:DNA-binding LacI/PurR family transcriptional regulator
MILGNPTINDVARAARTSKSTVSRYLNGYTVKKQTEEALKAAIQNLNYHPNANARRLVKNNTQVIGVVLDDIANNFYAEILRGIESVANSNGYQCVYYSGSSNYQGEFGFMDLAQERQVDGLILVSFLNRSQELLQKVQQLNFPIALIGDGEEDGNVLSVDVDNAFGVKEVVNYLYRIGHRNIAYITGPDDFSATHWRYQGYISAMEKLGLEYNPSWTMQSDWTEEGGHRAMRELLTFKEITSVIASNDEVAIGALLCARELGFNVPMDISIVGFDDIPVAKWVYPPLTSVKQPLYKMGEKVAKGLVERLNGAIEITEKRVLVEPNLIVRQSCRNL